MYKSTNLAVVDVGNVGEVCTAKNALWMYTHTQPNEYTLHRWIYTLAKPNQRPVLPTKHLNRGLFSDYYLDEIVPTASEFQSNTLFASVKTIRDELLERLDNLTPEALDEAQLEDRWIKPVFKALGHHWSVQVKIRYGDKGFRKPDYAFADTYEAAQELRNEIYTPHRG